MYGERGAGVRPFSRVSAGLCSSCETLYKLSSRSLSFFVGVVRIQTVCRQVLRTALCQALF